MDNGIIYTQLLDFFIAHILVAPDRLIEAAAQRHVTSCILIKQGIVKQDSRIGDGNRQAPEPTHPAYRPLRPHRSFFPAAPVPAQPGQETTLPFSKVTENLSIKLP